MVVAQAAALQAHEDALRLKGLEVEKLKIQLARLRRLQFGRSSERLAREIAQLELALEEIEIDAVPSPEAVARADEAAPSGDAKRRVGRHPLPAYLPRREVRHEPSCVCPACGGRMHPVGEDVTEILDYVPGRFESLPPT